MANKLSVDRNIEFKGFSKSDLSERFARIFRICNNFDIPILIIVDGWENSYRGKLIKEMTEEVAAKYLDVDVFDSEKSDDKYPFIRKFWINVPQKGHIKIFDRSFYYKLFDDLKLSDKEISHRVESIKSIEEMLYKDKTIIIKLFLNIDKDIQKDRVKERENSKSRSFYLDDLDKKQVENYSDYLDHFQKVLEKSSFSFSPWEIVDMNDEKDGIKEALWICLERLTIGIERVANQKKDDDRTQRSYKLKKPIISSLDLSKTIDKKDYKKEKDKLQKEVSDMMYEYYDRGISTVLVFEGVDAAGKDGSIERLIKKVDPRLYKVHGISAPSQEELSRHYLWRFYEKLPEDGHVGIFSRSWYGRVMVERVEGFATTNEWDRAYQEILDMEKQIYDHGSLIIKFFVIIDKKEQLKRFMDREKDPDKNYKITDEDWRNRNKWDEYIASMDEMLERTNVSYAPWIIVEGNQKRYARIKVMKEYLRLAKDHLKKIDKNK